MTHVCLYEYIFLSYIIKCVVKVTHKLSFISRSPIMRFKRFDLNKKNLNSSKKSFKKCEIKNSNNRHKHKESENYYENAKSFSIFDFLIDMSFQFRRFYNNNVSEWVRDDFLYDKQKSKAEKKVKKGTEQEWERERQKEKFQQTNKRKNFFFRTQIELSKMIYISFYSLCILFCEQHEWGILSRN